jgi:hypothetical protein
MIEKQIKMNTSVYGTNIKKIYEDGYEMRYKNKLDGNRLKERFVKIANEASTHQIGETVSIEFYPLSEAPDNAISFDSIKYLIVRDELNQQLYDFKYANIIVTAESM